MAKLPYLTRETAPASSQAVLDRLETERPVPTANVFRMLANAPEQLDAFLDYANSLRSCDLTPRMRELIVLTVGHAVDSQYEIAHHVPYAMKAGYSPEQIAAVPTAEDSGLFTETELALVRVARGFSVGADIPASDWARLAQELTTAQMTQLAMTASWYVSGALMMRALELELEPEYIKD
jgi:alkylhydroperoxidase family enzyme